MADFLASFGFTNQTPQPNNEQLGSVDALRQHLVSILGSKVTATRTEHVAITVELRAAVLLTLELSGPENDVVTGLADVDPSLGSGGSHNGLGDDGVLRTIKINDALAHQPRDNPVLQMAVAKHIISVISAADGSTWIAREVSCNSGEWTFMYICQDSLRMWTHQISKSHSVPVIGEFSYKDPDPVLMNRPAFDCRGSISIAFSRNRRTLVITYDHTPMHKTVAQLTQHYKPPQRELGPNIQKQKTPKKPPGSSKKDSAKAKDATGRPKKRSKKNNTEAQASVLATPAVAGENSSDNAQANGGGQQQQAPAVPSTLTINVTPAEAARRREAATAMLTNAGVDPSSLSPEQFNIFSNQSPDLQRDSLEMLVKYGAERLRIVHPGHHDVSASGTVTPSGTPAQTSQPSPSGPTTTKELVPRPQAADDGAVPTSNNDPATEAVAQSQATPKRNEKTGKSRLACSQCKQFKVKCPRERPTCAECVKKGLTCEYAPPKPRKKKLSEAAVPVDEDDEDTEVQQQIQQEQEEQQEEEPEDQSPPQPSPQENQARESGSHQVDYQQQYDQQSHVPDDTVTQGGYAYQPYIPASDAAPSTAQAALPEPQMVSSASLRTDSGHNLQLQDTSALSYLAASATSGPAFRHSQACQAPGPMQPQQQHTPSPRHSGGSTATYAPATKNRGTRKPLVDSSQAQHSGAELSHPQSPATARQLNDDPQAVSQGVAGRATPDQTASPSMAGMPPPRARSRQGQFAQRQAQAVDNSAGSSYRHSVPTQQSYATSAAATGYGQHDQYLVRNAPADDRSSQHIAYVPHAPQRQLHNYDMSSTHPRATTAESSQVDSATIMSNQPARHSSTQSRNTHANQTNAHRNTPSSYSQVSTSGNPLAHEYHMRAASSQAAPARGDNQQMQPAYQELAQTQHQQQAPQRHGWYNFDGASGQQQYAPLNQPQNSQNRHYDW